MRRLVCLLLVVGLIASERCALADSPRPVKNVVIYKEAGRFAGWPANNGIWVWGNEILVGFHLGYHKPSNSHPIDPDRPQVRRLARSLDGGEMWKIEVPSYLDAEGHERKPEPLPAPIEYTHPDFAMMHRMESSDKGFSYLYWSNDRGHVWKGPFALPTLGRPGIMARTDVIVDGPRDVMMFLTSAKDQGGEGWPLAARTNDGGMTWTRLSMIGEQPGEGEYAIMPTTVRLSPTELYTYIRCRTQVDGKRNFMIKPYRSLDNGLTWKLEAANTIENGGNPGHMIRLKDGRLALTYGSRKAPYGIHARLSSDGGKSWSDNLVLRDDGGNWDLGYPRTVERPDGKVVTVYYYNDREQSERYIAATIWEPR